MPRHPLAEQLGPHEWNDDRNKVEALEPIMGCRPWEQSSEAKPHAPCGVCRGLRSIDPAFVCLGCLRVARTVQAKLTADRWPSTEPPKERKPLSKKERAKIAAKLTRKERRSLVYAARGTKDGERWIEEMGLKTAG